MTSRQPTKKTVFLPIIPIIIIILATLLFGCTGPDYQPSSGSVALKDHLFSGDKQPYSTDDPAPRVVAQPTVVPDAGADPHDRQNDPTGIQPKKETRAIWSWAGRKVVSGNDKISPDDIDELVAKVDAANLNVVLLSVYADGTAFFEPSQTRFPNKSERLINQSTFPEYGYPDALSYLLQIRNARRADDDPTNDFEVHAWFAVNRGGNKKDGWPPEDKTLPYMLHALFPEFRQKYGDYYRQADDRFINYDISVIHQPKFRAYITDLIAGLVEDYDVDGVHLDHIRTGGICFNDEPLDYPGTEYDYPGCQEDYKRWTQQTYGQTYTLWNDTDGSRKVRDIENGRVAAWQEQGMRQLVNSIHNEVKRVDQKVIISVASVRNDITQSGEKQLRSGQVAWKWLDEGLIDAVFPTFYLPETEDVVNEYQAFSQAIRNENRRSTVFPGLITFTLNETEETRFITLWSDLVAVQVSALMRDEDHGSSLETPARGTALFFARRLSDEAIQALALGPFKEPAIPFWGE